VFLPMTIEAAVSARHDRALRADGAVEPPGDVYRAMQIVYPAAFLAVIAEGAWRGVDPDTLVGAGAGVFLAAKALKYWAIASLGPRWTFRVLVPPGSGRTVRGPYRWIAHPNYIAVALELTGVALAMHALASGPVAVVGFALLMLKRVQIEEKALAGR
jgi:methyltransferase